MRPHRAAKFRGPPNSTAPVTDSCVMVWDTRTGECHKQNTAREKHSARCCYYYSPTAQNYLIFFENLGRTDLKNHLLMQEPQKWFLQTHLLVVNECENSLIMKLRMSRLNATEKFRAEFFFTVMDNAIASFTELVPSVLWHCWLGHLTRKKPVPIWPILCWWDVKP